MFHVEPEPTPRETAYTFVKAEVNSVKLVPKFVDR
jgi:hypothetical protein